MVLVVLNRRFCSTHWTEESEKYFNMTLMTVTYWIPLAILLFTNYHSIKKLRHSPPVGELTDQVVESINKKKRVCKMMCFLLITFGICWLPYHSYFVVTNLYPHLKGVNGVQQVFLAFYWLAMSHAIVNPTVFFLLKKE